METELEYYSRRAAEGLHAAAHATSPEVQVTHRSLAEHYAVIVQQQENRPPEEPKEAINAG